MSARWSKSDINILYNLIEKGYTFKQIGLELNRTRSAIKQKSNSLGYISKVNKRKTIEDYKKEIPEDIEVLEEYINNCTNILHEHFCGYKWRARPKDILRGRGCPKCAKYGFNINKPAIVYLVHFYALDIYKIGITNNTIKKRFEQEFQPYKIIFYREFEKGQEAKNLETEWLNNLKPLLYNTGELKSGNTETFIECL